MITLSTESSHVVFNITCFYVYLKLSDHEEQKEIDDEPPAEMPVLDLRLTEEEEKQTLDLDEGFGEFDSSSSDTELLKEKKVFFFFFFLNILVLSDV